MVGIILILAAIIGIGAYGPAGNFIKSFAVFLVGNIYPFLLFGLLILGGYLIVKRKTPNLLSLRWIGFLYTGNIFLSSITSLKIYRSTFTRRNKNNNRNI